MKTFKIAHLYYDLMNLYGENGNVRFLTKELEKQDFKVEVHFLSLDDEINFANYDFYYIGMGSIENQRIVLEDLIKYKNEINEAINSGKYFLVTGNALDFFGKSITTLDNDTLEGLNTFDYDIVCEEFRIVGPQYYNCKLLDNYKIIGFQNRNSVLTNGDNSLFQVIEGTGYNPKVKEEGITYNNFYGTYLLGPLLVRNPYFTDYLVKKICKENKVKYHKNNENDYVYKAYNEYLNNFYKDK